MEPYIQAAEDLCIPVFVYQIEAPRDLLLERILSRPKPTMAKTPVSRERIESNLDSYFENKYLGARIVFDSSKFSPDEILEQMIANMEGDA